MLCSQCGRENQAGLDYCDYCGEALPTGGGAGPKRKTAMESPEMIKRKTAMEAPEAKGDAFERAMSGEVDDPFAPSTAQQKQRSAPAAAPTPAPQKKRVTTFDAPGAGSNDDPFAPPGKGDRGADPTRRIVGFLITFDGHPNGKHWLIYEGRNLLGRDTERCEIVIEGDDKISSQHAVLVWRAGRLRLADDKSQNGTFLDEEDVLQPEEVADGAVIRVGRTRLICRLLDTSVVDKLWKPSA